MPKVMPAQKPGKSEQDVETPRDFMAAVRRRFGKPAVDLAANSKNTKCSLWVTPETDSLVTDWPSLAPGKRLWLNPTYAKIKPWAAKCASEALRGAKPMMLVPASVGSDWFERYVFGHCLVLFLQPRITFVGHTHPYPKDLMLCVYGQIPGIEVWRWKK